MADAMRGATKVKGFPVCTWSVRSEMCNQSIVCCFCMVHLGTSGNSDASAAYTCLCSEFLRAYTSIDVNRVVFIALRLCVS